MTGTVSNQALSQESLLPLYKETNFQTTPEGKIPKDWQNTALEEVAIDLIGGGTPSTAFKEYWNGNIAWMTSAHINGMVVTKGQKYISKEGLEKSATHLVPKDNLLVATRVGIGKVAVNQIDIAISQDLTGVIIDKTKADPAFLYWAILSNKQKLKAIAQGSTIKGILRDDLGKLKLPMPQNVAEQRAIVGVLGVVDSAIELADRVVAQTERLKRGLMQQLLTRGIGHTETKQTPIGKLPQDWKPTQLKDVVLSYKNGIYKPSQYAGKGLPCVRMYNIVAGRINHEKAALLDVTEQELEEFGVKAGDIIVNRVNTAELVGKAGVIPDGFGKATFESKNIRMRLDTKKVSPDFFAIFVQTKEYSNQLLSRAKTAVAQATVTQEDLDSVVIPLPPTLSEQQKIAEIISAMDKKLLLERQEKERLERIKRGLMDLLLTGKVRIKVD